MNKELCKHLEERGFLKKKKLVQITEFFVRNYQTREERAVHAEDEEEACQKLGWTYNNCFVFTKVSISVFGAN